MAQDITSSTGTFCTATQLFDFVDSRVVASMLRDNESEDLPTESDMIDPETPAGARLASLLRAGSGEVEAACLPRAQYSVADLEAIAASTTNAAMHLRRVTAGCTILAAFSRRHTSSGTKPEDYLAVLHAMDSLEKLRVGEHVFGLVGNIYAGAGMSTSPTEAQRSTEERNTVAMASRFFGNRGYYRTGGR